MIPERETFGGTWPFAPRYFGGNGFRMHFVDEGEGEPIICLHGEPTWVTFIAALFHLYQKRTA